MMHSIKRESPLKHDLKLGVNKSLPIKTQDGENLIGLMTKNLKSQNSPQASSSKVNSKAGSPKTKLPIKQEVSPKSSIKKLTKRKEENIESKSPKKKAKGDINVENKSKNLNEQKLHIKKQNKSKSIYNKDSASFVCKFCCRRFRSVELLKEHLLSHGDKSEYICHICNHEAACFSALMTHVVKHSRKSDKEIMSNQTSNNLSNLEKSKPSFSCNMCKSSFSSSQKLANHLCPAAVKKNEYLCAYCGQVSGSVEDYRCHVQSHSVTPFMCTHCKQKLPTKKLLDKHFDSCKKRPKAKFKCEICFFECKGKRELNHHLKICKLVQESPPLNCTQCHSSFSNKVNFQLHRKNCKANVESCKTDQAEIDKNSFLCSTCGEIFDTKVCYDIHKQECSDDSPDINERTSVLCSFCGDFFHFLQIEEHKRICNSQHNKDLSTHQNKDVDVNKQLNLEDSPNTRRSARLVRKKSILSSEEDARRNDAPKPKRIKKLKIVKKFKGRKGRQSKLGKENFMCGECSLTFCSKSTLLRHKRMHSGNPWYSCQFCGKYFFRKDVFNRHEMNVHSKSNKTVFCCYYCKLFFNAASLLKEHVAANHKENSVFHVKTRIIAENNTQEDNDTHIQIKQEAGTVENESPPTSAGSPKGVHSTSSYMVSPYKKCGICFETFETNLEVEEHLLSHPLPENCESSEGGISISNAPKVDEVASSNITSKILTSNDQSSSVVSINADITTNVISSKPRKRLKTTPTKTLNELDQSSQKDTLSTDFTHNEKEIYQCKLCLKTFNNRDLFAEHEAQSHVMLDWYQCLVCDASGTKKDMQEHMFQHMYKVGSFVVANNYDGMNDILPCLQQYDIESNDCCNAPAAAIVEKDQNESIKLSECDEINIELPKLKYCGSSCPEMNDMSISNASNSVKVADSVSLNLEVEKPSTIEHVSSECSDDFIDSNIVICNKNIPEENTVMSNKDMFERNTSHNHDLEKITSVCSERINVPNNLSESNKNNSKDPFQELRRILKEDNIPLNEGNKSAIPNKVLISLDDKTSDNQNHSQLRYLLEKSNFDEIPDKTDSYNQQNENAKELDASKSESEQTSDAISSMKNLIQDLKSLNKLVAESAPDPDISDELNLKTLPEKGKTSAVTTKPSFNTCLKFDINQSRGEYSETSNVTKLDKNLFEFHKTDKGNNIFQPSNSQNTILDFSDLLKIGDTIGASDNSIFGCTSQSSGLFDLHNNAQDVNPAEKEKDSNNSCGFGNNLLSTEMLKCNNCNETFEEYSDLIKHSCSKTVSSIEQSTENKSKANFSLPFDLTKSFVETDVKTAKNKHTTFENSIHRSETMFSCCICSKTQNSHFKLEQHYHSDHNCFTGNSLSNNKCVKCYETFFTVADFMKHSLNCLKSNWYSNNSLQDGLKYQGVLQSLLSKPESQISPNCTDITSDNDFSYDNILNLSRNPFS